MLISKSMAFTVLAPEPLRADLFQPFGDVIEVAEGRRHFSINDGFAERYHGLAQVDVMHGSGYPIISIFRTKPRQFPMALRLLERHPLGSQAFFPLSPHPYLVVVATGGDAPDLASLRCFRAMPGQGVNYARGVWHHPLIALNARSDFLVVDRDSAKRDNNCDEFSLADSAISVQFSESKPDR